MLCLLLKFIYSEKATKFCEIFPLLLTVCTVVKSKGKILQNFVAFSEYMNFKISRKITNGFHNFDFFQFSWVKTNRINGKIYLWAFGILHQVNQGYQVWFQSSQCKAGYHKNQSFSTQFLLWDIHPAHTVIQDLVLYSEIVGKNTRFFFQSI